MNKASRRAVKELQHVVAWAACAECPTPEDNPSTWNRAMVEAIKFAKKRIAAIEAEKPANPIIDAAQKRAEGMAQALADHVADAGKKVEPAAEPATLTDVSWIANDDVWMDKRVLNRTKDLAKAVTELQELVRTERRQ